MRVKKDSYKSEFNGNDKEVRKAKEQRYYEQDIKDGLLYLSHMFEREEGLVKDDELRVAIFEKAIMRGKCIMDCLMIDTEGTSIGLEIKTERDSTTRLNKQLRMYSLVCKYVYVVCHDDFIDKVEQVIKRYKHHHVGIISYISFDDEPVFGKYKQAKPSPIHSNYHMLDVLWKAELIRMHGKDRFKNSSTDKEKVMAHDKLRHEARGMVNKSLRKPAIIQDMIGVRNDDQLKALFGKAMVLGIKDSDKQVTKHPFQYRNPTDLKYGGDFNDEL